MSDKRPDAASPEARGESGGPRPGPRSFLARFFDWYSPPRPVPQSIFTPAWMVCALKRLAVWNLDMAVRYAPAVKILRGQPGTSVLEVGGGAYGVTGFARQEVTGCDLSFDGPKLGLVRGCVGSAEALPFADSSFEVVLSMDTLEHMDRDRFTLAASELCRVAARGVILGVPCGQAARDADEKLDARWRRRFGTSHRWLKDHIARGLPEPEEVRGPLEQAAREKWGDYSLEVINNAGTRLWSAYMRLLLHPSRITAGLVNKLVLPFWRLLLLFDSGPPYRRIFVVRGRSPAAREA